MNKEEVQRLYKETVLPASRQPYHFELDPEAEVELSAYNPMCGDQYKLFLRDGGNLELMHFHGIGCALSKASGSMMIKTLESRSIEEARELTDRFIQQVATGQFDANLPDELRVLVELKNFEGREDCITLTWKALLTHLQNQR